MPCQIDTIDQSAQPPTSIDHSGEQPSAREESPSSIISSQACRQPLFCHWPQYGSHIEARGWAYDAVGRSLSFIGNAAFVGTAVVQLARIDAGCDPEDAECSGRTQYAGIRPSSLLALYNVIVGLASSALLPLLGAVVDHTSVRRLIGRISAIIYCATLFPMIFLSESTWFAVAILLIISAFVGWIHSGMSFAYLPEMSDDKDVLERLNTSFAVVQYGTDVVYIIVVVAIAAAMGWVDDSLATSRVAQSINFVATTAVWGYAWWGGLLGRRAAMSPFPEEDSLLTVGFKRLYKTCVRIYKNYPALASFYPAIRAFSESATQALLVIGQTYSIELLQFSSAETGIFLLILLIFSSIGCYLSPISLRFFSPIQSNQLCLFFLGLFTAGAAGFVKDAGQKVLFYVFAMFWGACGGWKYTIERYLTCTIIPKGQDAELMGLYLFSGQVLTWLPPLVFAAMNEAGVSIRISMLSLILFWLFAIVFLQLMGSYDKVVREANDERGGSRMESSHCERDDVVREEDMENEESKSDAMDRVCESTS
ncbi:hypothetical protein ACHAXS_013380 [Conticribra weissflogii]